MVEEAHNSITNCNWWMDYNCFNVIFELNSYSNLSKIYNCLWIKFTSYILWVCIFCYFASSQPHHLFIKRTILSQNFIWYITYIKIWNWLRTFCNRYPFFQKWNLNYWYFQATFPGIMFNKLMEMAYTNTVYIYSHAQILS